ncbi:MAG TPA: GTP cyclohydrolase II [Rhodospirillales bacterium]|nr:GTP cyclohydrolase II [Rhodospirillales bacterium]
MPHRFQLQSMPASRDPVSLLAVDRCVSELRRGRIVAVRGSGGVAALILAAEAVTTDTLADLATISHSRPALTITRRRARVLGLGGIGDTVMVLDAPDGWSADAILEIADPLSALDADLKQRFNLSGAGDYSCQSAAIGLAKLARLLPAAVVADLAAPDADDLNVWAGRHDMLVVDAGDVFQYEHTAARTLKAVSEARVPLSAAENTRIIAFRPIDGGLEHLAIVIGEPRPDNAGDGILTRLHSECFTGDLLGSLRCDCGDQLRGAIGEIARSGGGVLLYLAQEGRGIGLVNKLRAYQLQDAGFDTIDANEQLGFDADERVYLPAAEMLRQLGFNKVRLMTNNPDKIDALSKYGVQVTGRVAHSFPANKHNETYLKTKAGRSGHLI